MESLFWEVYGLDQAIAWASHESKRHVSRNLLINVLLKWSMCMMWGSKYYLLLIILLEKDFAWWPTLIHLLKRCHCLLCQIKKLKAMVWIWDIEKEIHREVSRIGTRTQWQKINLGTMTSLVYLLLSLVFRSCIGIDCEKRREISRWVFGNSILGAIFEVIPFSFCVAVGGGGGFGCVGSFFLW